MSNSYFQFKQFTIHQDRSAMKVTTDSCLFGAWVAEKVSSRETEVRSLLDIGTGTGLLSLMIAQKNPSIAVDAIEIDIDAFEQAKQNVLNSPWTNNVRVVRADAREFSSSKKYDVIVCNPPFYEKELKSDDAKKNRAHHSQELLLPQLLEITRENLTPGGNFFLLLPYKRNAEIKKLLQEKDMVVEELLFVRQTLRHDYFRILLMGKLQSNGLIETTISQFPIKNEDEKYSNDFHSFLKDYYLHL